MGKFDQVSASKDPSESSFFSSSTENMYRFWFTCNLILIGIFYGTACTNLRVFVDGNIGSDSLCGSSLVSLCEFAGSPLSSFFLSFFLSCPLSSQSKLAGHRCRGLSMFSRAGLDQLGPSCFFRHDLIKELSSSQHCQTFLRQTTNCRGRR